MLSRAQDLYKKYERWVPILFFALGFVFDTYMLRRIDELKTILQQAAYLLLAGILIAVELIDHITPITVPRWLAKVWKYREAFLHFLLGTLLNSYTIFYFKSASAVTSFIFIVLLIGLLIINEFKHFGDSQTKVHMAFWSLCLISYSVSLAPILIGSMGLLPFLLANLGSLLVFALFYTLLKAKLTQKPGLAFSHVLIPYSAIQLIFALLYFAHAIPPVPLSVSYMGIFHKVEKGEGDYTLSYTRPAWKFWQHGDQTFLARPGDAIYCFVRIFSPSRFSDKLQIRWLYHDDRQGWLSADAIPMPITGGREEGYRAITRKSNYQPGQWRVQVETLDSREVGRINFTVVPDDSVSEPEIKTIVQ